MNKHLVAFIDDELQNNSYYECIRRFAKDKDWHREILSTVISQYGNNIDAFGPYRFLDAIEDFLASLYYDAEELSSNKADLLLQTGSLDEIIDAAWEQDYFENY